MYSNVSNNPSDSSGPLIAEKDLGMDAKKCLGNIQNVKLLTSGTQDLVPIVSAPVI